MPRKVSILRWLLIGGVLAMVSASGEPALDSIGSPPVGGSATSGASAPESPVHPSPVSVVPSDQSATVAVVPSDQPATVAVVPSDQPATVAVVPPPPPPSAPPTNEVSAGPPYLVATTSRPVAVHRAPDEGSPSRALDPASEVGGQLVFLVKQERPAWLEVYLPVRPNGSTGWLRRGDVELYQHDYRIELSLSRRRLVLFDRAEVVMDEPIGVGGDQTPTPGGIYYIKELLRPPDPTGFYGPYAYGLSGFSEVLLDYAGGQGVLGIHGTNDASSIGRNMSNGCIRLDNATITKLVEQVGLPLGTPVVVRT